MDEKIHPLHTYFSSSQIQVTDTNKKLFSYLTPSQIQDTHSRPGNPKKKLFMLQHTAHNTRRNRAVSRSTHRAPRTVALSPSPSPILLARRPVPPARPTPPPFSPAAPPLPAAPRATPPPRHSPLHPLRPPQPQRALRLRRGR
jgi:hypothetical protein